MRLDGAHHLRFRYHTTTPVIWVLLRNRETGSAFRVKADDLVASEKIEDTEVVPHWSQIEFDFSLSESVGTQGGALSGETMITDIEFKAIPARKRGKRMGRDGAPD